MQAASLKILCNVCILAKRGLQSEFHTSACALKGSRHPKNGSSKSQSAPKSARPPARKRLVSSLRPGRESGTYEVASREHVRSRDKPRYDPGARTSRTSDRWSKSSRKEGGTTRDGGPPRGERVTSERNLTPAPLREEKKFSREDAPHRDRIPVDDYRGREPRRRGVDFGFRGGAARPPRFKPSYDAGGLLGRRGYDQAKSAQRPQISKAPASPPLPDEFHTPEFEPLKTLPSRFSSPPLTEGLLQSVHDILGPSARPTPIQSLALKHLLTPPPHLQPTGPREHATASSSRAIWSQHLLAAETGSGKSIAYLLPMLQHLKLTEHNPIPVHAAPSGPRLSLNPRGLILAPTHELARQLTVFAKSLLHHMRLRVLCTSQANTPNPGRRTSTARQLKRGLEETGFGMTGVDSVGLHGTRPVDILVGTTTKVLEMVRGLGWDRAARIEDRWDEARKERSRRWIPGPPEMGLAGVEWVVVDEADVLFDRDFEASTRLLLADIARARGYMHPSFAALDSSSETPVPPPSTPLAYPFHLTFTSATIPTSLENYLSVAHPKLARLASPRLHRLPPTLTTENANWTSGNKNADIEKRIRRVWADDVQKASKTRSKVLVFCNKSSKVDDLGLYLKEKGIPNVALTSESALRVRGSNRHLDGFLKAPMDRQRTVSSPSQTENTPYTPGPPVSPAPSSISEGSAQSPSDPHVLITTSLLSRGLDFSPQIRYVFVTDTPRNMVDFLHRAGRAGRAGNAGHVVLFGKSKGRGSGEAQDVRRRVGAIAH